MTLVSPAQPTTEPAAVRARSRDTAPRGGVHGHPPGHGAALEPIPAGRCARQPQASLRKRYSRRYRHHAHWHQAHRHQAHAEGHGQAWWCCCWSSACRACPPCCGRRCPRRSSRRAPCPREARPSRHAAALRSAGPPSTQRGERRPDPAAVLERTGVRRARGQSALAHGHGAAHAGPGAADGRARSGGGATGGRERAPARRPGPAGRAAAGRARRAALGRGRRCRLARRRAAPAARAGERVSAER